MLLREFIVKINETFSGLIQGIQTYGLAQSIVRTRGEEFELFPGVVGKDGEVTDVTIDDSKPVIIYHRNSGITTQNITRQGFGDDKSDLMVTYQMAMIVFVNHKKTKLYPEELFLFLQANIPEALKVTSPYKSVFIRTTNVILNSRLVFAAEYSGTQFSLPESMSLFQINYVIESTFTKNCFAKCPEDC
jgi:hypothetical protein